MVRTVGRTSGQGDPPRPAAYDPALAADIVAETIAECERLIVDAEATAEQIRRTAADDAAQLRREAMRSTARMAGELEQRRPQVETILAGAKAVAEQARSVTDEVVADAERHAAEIVEGAQARARQVDEEAARRFAVTDARRREVDEARRIADARYAAADARLAEADARLAGARDLLSAAESRMAEVQARHAAADERAAAADARMAAAEVKMAEAEEQLNAAHARLTVAEARMAAAEARFAEATALAERGEARHAEGAAALASAEALAAEVAGREQALEARREELDRRYSQLWAESIVAAARARQSIDDAEAWALQHRTAAEAEAAEVVGHAWEVAATLQRELIEEADAQALELTWRASVDATRIREEAEIDARALRAVARRELAAAAPAEAAEARGVRRSDDVAAAGAGTQREPHRSDVIVIDVSAGPPPTPAAPPVPAQEPTAPRAAELEIESDHDLVERVWEPLPTPGHPATVPELAPAERVEVEPAPAGTQHHRAAGWRRRLLAVAAVLVGALLIRTFLLASYTVSNHSMAPTLEDGQRIVVNKVVYDLWSVRRGDVVVLADSPDRPNDTLVKRVVALGGETVEGRGGRVYVDGRELAEPYLDTGVVTADFPAVDLRSDELFVLGDNRDVSTDSRAFGPVAEADLVGRAEVILWPPSDIGGL